MKRALTFTLVLATALPLLGDDTKKAEGTKSKPAKAEQPASAQSTTAEPAAAGGDSPLVAAARRSNRLGRKSASPVITNETLKNAKGHVTTTTVDRPLNVPEPELGPEGKMIADNAKRAAEEQKARAEAAEKERKAAEAKTRARAEAAAAAEDGYDGTRDDADELIGPSEERPPQF